MNITQTTFFPDMITQHPSADIPIDGVTSRLVQAGQQQFIFMEFDQDVEVPEHSHNAQWGVVLDGEIELTINGQIQTLTKGDSYHINKKCDTFCKNQKGVQRPDTFRPGGQI